MICGGFFLQWNGVASGCAEASNGSWICGDVAGEILHKNGSSTGQHCSSQCLPDKVLLPQK